MGGLFTALLVVLLITFAPARAAAQQTRFPHLLSRFTTAFEPGEVARNTNIRLAARRLNGIVLQPNAVLSFNHAVGPRETEATDFEAAPVLTARGKTLGVGGGICQVSSTLYNAALLANLGINERHPHSKVVRYLPPGRDAAVSQDGTDLKLKNTTPLPMRLKAEVRGNHLTFSFWSPQPKKSLVRIVTAPRRASVPGWAVGVVVTRIVERDGSIVRREKLSEDKYRGRL